MELPEYFLADLPDESALTSDLISEACFTLKRNRERFLLPRTTESVIQLLAKLARDWQNPDFHFRQRILADGPAQTGFSREILGKRLDALFSQITPANLHALVAQDLGHAKRLDEMVPEDPGSAGDRASLACGPDLLVQITGGVLPNPPITSIILGLLARSPQFIKCASGTAFVPRMFAHSIYEAEPKIGACLEIADFKSGNQPLEDALFAAATCVTATGSDETLNAIRRRLPATVRFVGYGHRVSFAYITGDMLAKLNLPKMVGAVADDVVAWNQLGCLSPHVVYVEPTGALEPHDFAGLLAEELQAREAIEPRGRLPENEAAAIASRRMLYQARASQDEDETTRIWMSENSTDWTVVFEADPHFQSSCLNRFIYVKPVSGLEQLFQAIAPITGRVSTVGLSAPVSRAQEIATRLARWGATRICPVGKMQEPPLTWRHDGRPSLGDLVTWTDWEY